MWHTNLAMADPDGTRPRVFPTRALFTGEGALAELVDFTAAQHLQAVAAHELGHFLVNWKLGARILRISVQEDRGNIIPEGVVYFEHPDGDDARPVLVGGAAGERACDRWLHEKGLWTPARAVYGEVQGETDREAAQRSDPSITFDGGPNDYRHLQDEADKILDDVWPLLLRGLEHFSDFAEYTGDELCALLGIASGPTTEPPTKERGSRDDGAQPRAALRPEVRRLPALRRAEGRCRAGPLVVSVSSPAGRGAGRRDPRPRLPGGRLLHRLHLRRLVGRN